MIIRQYSMQAPVGGEQILMDALVSLAEEIRPIEGCLGFEILRNLDDPTRVVFVERWVSVDAHQGSGSQLTKDVLTPLMAALAGPAEGAYFTSAFQI